MPSSNIFSQAFSKLLFYCLYIGFVNGSASFAWKWRGLNLSIRCYPQYHLPSRAAIDGETFYVQAWGNTPLYKPSWLSVPLVRGQDLRPKLPRCPSELPPFLRCMGPRGGALGGASAEPQLFPTQAQDIITLFLK